MHLPALCVCVHAHEGAHTRTHFWEEIKKKTALDMWLSLFTLSPSARNALVPENDENRRQPVSLNFLPGPYQRARESKPLRNLLGFSNQSMKRVQG